MPIFMPKPKMACPGAACPGCSSAECMSKGGVATETVASNRQHQKGVHQSISKSDAGTSNAGAYVPGHGYGSNVHTAKRLHREKLEEQRAMKKPNLYAEGGAVDSWSKREDHEMGVHKPMGHGKSDQSWAGDSARREKVTREKGYSSSEDYQRSGVRAHRKVLGELRSMPKPKLMAEGGEVENTPEHADAEQDQDLLDNELGDMMGDELMAAFDSKDKKRIKESIEAIVLSCLSKE